MDRDALTERSSSQEDTAAEGYRPLPGSEEELEETEALKRNPGQQEIFRPREPGPHPRP